MTELIFITILVTVVAAATLRWAGVFRSWWLVLIIVVVLAVIAAAAG